MTALLSMVILGIVCWLFRITFITLIPAERLPVRVQAGLEHLAPAVLASIVAVELLGLTRGAPPIHVTTLLASSVVLGIVAYRTRNLSIVSVLGVIPVVLLDLVFTQI